MSKLSVEQKSIEIFMGDRKNSFLIPDYQRPYIWEDEECLTLWNDIFSFAFPDNGSDFNEEKDYFLGALVIFKNQNNKIEVIDGQQRLITITLLLRAFYEAYGDHMTSEDSNNAKKDIERCLWKIPQIGKKLDMSKLKIVSEVATENDIEEFKNIMIDGNADKKYKSRYAKNYRLFQNKIKEFLENYPSYFDYMPARILSNCSMLPIEAEEQDTALRIFSTLNDRGKPLSDSDIFKAKLYKAYYAQGKKDSFIAQWKEFEDMCGKIFVSGKSNPVDDIFMRYMFFARASKGIIDTSVEKLRDFYVRNDDKFSLLTRDFEQTFKNLTMLAEFWRDVTIQDQERFSERVLKQLFVLHYMPNNIWTFTVSVYFMANKDDNRMLDDQSFYEFLRKITGFLLASRIIRPGNPTPFFHAMVKIVRGEKITFEGYKFDIKALRERITQFDFNDSRKITKGMITWYVFQDSEQELLSLEKTYDTEHILPRARKEELQNKANLEALGNKSLLEKGINIRASDYRFSDKKKYYLGKIKGKQKTNINELISLAKIKEDFTEQDIEERNAKIIESFINFMKENDLIK